MNFFLGSRNNQNIKPHNKNITTIIDKDMLITGNLSFKGKAKIEGTIKGNIKGDYLILSSTGFVTGDIDSEILICDGKIEGNVKTDKLVAHKSAVIHGKVETSNLNVETGATLNGEIKTCFHNIQQIQGKPQEKLTALIEHP